MSISIIVAHEYTLMTSTTTVKVIDNVEAIFSRHGLPITIKSDNGPQFTSGEFQEYSLQNGIMHLKTTIMALSQWGS